MSIPGEHVWFGWKRPRDTHGLRSASWQPVPGASGKTRLEAHSRLMELTEMVAGDGTWEYAILPTGERPRDEPPTYKDRMMRPLR